MRSVFSESGVHFDVEELFLLACLVLGLLDGLLLLHKTAEVVIVLVYLVQFKIPRYLLPETNETAVRT